jgi:hypothetical protein
MATKVYRYEPGHVIEALPADPAKGGACGAVMVSGICRFEGTLLQCLIFLKDLGDEMAARHARLYYAEMQSRANPKVVRANDRRSFLNRRRIGQ